MTPVHEKPSEPVKKLPGIRTQYWAKPIPDDRFDWEAFFDGYEPGDPVGFGPTEEAAIADLMEQAE